MTTQEDMFGTSVSEDDDLLFEVEGLDEIDSKFVVPDGWWCARVLDVEKKLSKSMKPMLEISFVLTGEWLDKNGDIEDAPGDHGGKEFKTWVSLSASALFKVKEMAEALELPIENGRVKAGRSDIMGAFFCASMKEEEYQGRKSSKLQTWGAHPRGAHAD